MIIKTPSTVYPWKEFFLHLGFNSIYSILLSDSTISIFFNLKYIIPFTINENRIVVLKELIKYLTDNKEECLNETMINAGWFGETEIVKFLIKNGANKGYKNQNDLGLLECSERVEKQFKDSSLKEFLKNNQ